MLPLFATVAVLPLPPAPPFRRRRRRGQVAAIRRRSAAAAGAAAAADALREHAVGAVPGRDRAAVV